MVRWLWPVCGALLALAACDGSSAGGRAGDGAGGVSLGADPADRFGDTPGVPVELSFVSFEIRSQVWAPWVADQPFAPQFELFLGERDGGCDTFDAGSAGAGPHLLWVRLSAPAVGTCARDSTADGCRFGVTLEPGPGRGVLPFAVEAREASLRIDRFDGQVLAGELRAAFPVNPELLVSAGWDGPSYCEDTSGQLRRCPNASPEEPDPCNAGKPLEEVVVPISATFCAAAVGCTDATHCAAVEQALACPPPPVDCEATCAGFAESCGSCLACEEGDEWCEGHVERSCAPVLSSCPAECAAAAGQRLAAVATACLAAGVDCAGWNGCLAACGDVE